MFNFLRKRQEELKLYAPLKGKIVDITETPDPVFSSKILGDGIAIEPNEGIVVAPCAGKIEVIPSTKHAIGMRTASGVELLIHVGLNTVELDGHGFELHVKVGDQVSCGDKLLTFDRKYILEQDKSLITPIVITNGEEKVKDITKYFDAIDAIIMKVKIK